MIEALLFAAIELNGALISRGAQFQLNDKVCAIEADALMSSISQDALARHLKNKLFVTAPEDCRFQEADNVLQLRLPQRFLARRMLTLSEPASALGIALLHQPNALIEHADYASRPQVVPLNALAFDLFLGDASQGLGMVATKGPWSLQALNQHYRGQPAFQRATGDYLFKDGGLIRIGDVRGLRTPGQILTDLRGLSLTNRAPALRGHGKTEAELVIQSPSRVQFFDRAGSPVYSSEVLPPGNYQVQGYGASGIPGILQARLVDIQGNSQTIDLAWTADRRLLSKEDIEWDFFIGQPRQIDGGLSRASLLSGRLAYGLSPQFTAGLYVERFHHRRQASAELSSRAIPGLLMTTAAGTACSRARCQPAWLFEARSSLSRHATLIAGVSQTEDIMARDSQLRSQQISLSGRLNSKLSGVISLATTQGQRRHQAALGVSGSYRLGPQMSLLFQLRQTQHERTESWSGYLGLSVYFAKQKTTASSILNHQSSAPKDGKNRLNLQLSRASEGLYGPEISLAHDLGMPQSTSAYTRYKSPYGEASVRLHHQTMKGGSTAAWSLSSRLWLTNDTVYLGPAGEENLVIQNTGKSGIEIEHSGRDRQTSAANGMVIFRKAPAWTDGIYLINQKSIPFDLQLAAHRIRIPLAANRAYRVDLQALWTEPKGWQIVNLFGLDLDDQPGRLKTAQGRSVFLTPEGHADLWSASELPLQLRTRSGRLLACNTADPAEARRQQVRLFCQPKPML